MLWRTSLVGTVANTIPEVRIAAKTSAVRVAVDEGTAKGYRQAQHVGETYLLEGVSSMVVLRGEMMV